LGHLLCRTPAASLPAGRFGPGSSGRLGKTVRLATHPVPPALPVRPARPVPHPVPLARLVPRPVTRKVAPAGLLRNRLFHPSRPELLHQELGDRPARRLQLPVLILLCRGLSLPCRATAPRNRNPISRAVCQRLLPINRFPQIPANQLPQTPRNPPEKRPPERHPLPSVEPGRLFS